MLLLVCEQWWCLFLPHHSRHLSLLGDCSAVTHHRHQRHQWHQGGWHDSHDHILRFLAFGKQLALPWEKLRRGLSGPLGAEPWRGEDSSGAVCAEQRAILSPGWALLPPGLGSAKAEAVAFLWLRSPHPFTGTRNTPQPQRQTLHQSKGLAKDFPIKWT